MDIDQIPVTGIEVLKDDIPPVDELVEAFTRSFPIITDLFISFVELEEKGCLI